MLPFRFQQRLNRMFFCLVLSDTLVYFTLDKRKKVGQIDFPKTTLRLRKQISFSSTLSCFMFIFLCYWTICGIQELNFVYLFSLKICEKNYWSKKNLVVGLKLVQLKTEEIQRIILLLDFSTFKLYTLAQLVEFIESFGNLLKWKKCNWL
jgi:hypothetical protein